MIIITILPNYSDPADPTNSESNRYESLVDLTANETSEDHEQIPKDNENNIIDSTNDSSKVIIAGDSIIKHLNGFKMSTGKTKVHVSTFPGCTTLDMKDHIKTIVRKNPDKLIVHVHLVPTVLEEVKPLPNVRKK